MYTDESTVTLSEEECWELLSDASVGRLAVDTAGRPDIFPVNYAVDDRSIVFRTAAGSKLAGAVLMRHVAFEIDGYEPDARTAWSVVVKGVARQVEQADDLWAQDLPLFPWFASPKPNVVRIEPRAVTGRRFRVPDEITPDSSVGWKGSATNPATADFAPGVRASPGAEYHPGAPTIRPD